MTPQSAKAKGRRLQQQVAEEIRQKFNLSVNDVKSIPMGSQGCDIWLSTKALEFFPFSIECKNVERLNVVQAFEQARANMMEGYPPIVIHSRNRGEVLVTLRLRDFLNELDVMGQVMDDLKGKA